jgi:hypothetical protein
MSRGFVKEDDQEELLLYHQEQTLPEGVVNYVTQGGIRNF